MKIAILADTHAGARNDNTVFNDAFLKFFDEIFFPYIVQNNIKHIIHLGDVFDRRKYINFNTLHAWQTNVFERLNTAIDRMDIILGNHDLYFKNTHEISSVKSILSAYEHFHIHESPVEVDLDGVKALYLPWICDSTRDISSHFLEKSPAKICFGHLEILGFELIPGHTNTEHGFKPDIFERFYMTISGHYHTPSSANSIHYVGAPYQLTWNDWNQQRGFNIFDTKSMSLTFVPNPYEIFHKIYYDDTNPVDPHENDFSYIKGKYIKVIVVCKTDPASFDTWMNLLEKQNPADLVIVESSVDANPTDALLSDEEKDTLTILLEYIESLEMSEHKNALRNLLKELYLEAVDITSKSS